jgi:Ca2+/Na+ antiporter
MIFDVNRHVDKEVEYFGLKGKSVYYPIFAIIIAFTLYYVISSFINAFLVLIILLLAWFVFIFYIRKLNRKYGSSGLEKKASFINLPASIKRNYKHLKK